MEAVKCRKFPNEEEEYKVTEKPSLLRQYDIPVTHLDFDYVLKCKDSKELEKILHILNSGEEGYFPELIKVTENCLAKLKPKSKLLRKTCPVLTKDTLNKNEWNEISQDIDSWVSKMTQNNKELKTHQIGRDEIEAPVRTAGEKKLETTKKHNPKRISSTDYESWDKYDVDSEILKMDLEEEKLKKECKQKENKKKETKKVTFKEFTSNVEALYEANREKEKGNEFFRAGDYNDALTHYNNSILYMPSAATYSNRAITHIKLENYKKALADCERALQLEPNNIKANLRKAQSLYALKKYKEASNSIEIVIKLDSNNKSAQELSEKLQKFNETDKKSKRFEIEDVQDNKNNFKEEKRPSILKQTNINKNKRNFECILPIPGTSKMSPPFYKIVKSNDPKIIRQEKLKIHNALRLVHLTKYDDTSDDDDCFINHLKNKCTKEEKNVQKQMKTIEIIKKQKPVQLDGNQHSIKFIKLQNDKGGSGEPYISKSITEINENNIDINSPYSFLKAWCSIGKDINCTRHAEVLRSLDMSRIDEVIGYKLDNQMLSDILKCLYLHFTIAGEEEMVLTALSNIVRIPRFNIVSLFMTKDDKICVHNLIQFLNQHDKILPDDVVKQYIN